LVIYRVPGISLESGEGKLKALYEIKVGLKMPSVLWEGRAGMTVPRKKSFREKKVLLGCERHVVSFTARQRACKAKRESVDI
jgi:hypothetical protein